MKSELASEKVWQKDVERQGEEGMRYKRTRERDWCGPSGHVRGGVCNTIYSGLHDWHSRFPPRALLSGVYIPPPPREQVPEESRVPPLSLLNHFPLLLTHSDWLLSCPSAGGTLMKPSLQFGTRFSYYLQLQCNSLQRVRLPQTFPFRKIRFQVGKYYICNKSFPSQLYVRLLNSAADAWVA